MFQNLLVTEYERLKKQLEVSAINFNYDRLTFLGRSEDYDKEFIGKSMRLNKAWRSDNLKGRSTWYPIPNEVEFEELMKTTAEDLELLERNAPMLEEANKKLKKKRSEKEEDLERHVRQGHRLEEELEDKNMEIEELKALKKQTERKEKKHPAVIKIKADNDELCGKVKNEVADTNEEINRVGREIEKKKEKERSRSERKGKNELKRNVDKKERDELRNKWIREAEARKRSIEEKIKLLNDMEIRSSGPVKYIQKKIANVLSSLFGKNSFIYQSYHGILGKHLANKKKGMIYEIHQWIAELIRKLFGMKRVGLDN